MRTGAEPGPAPPRPRAGGAARPLRRREEPLGAALSPGAAAARLPACVKPTCSAGPRGPERPRTAASPARLLRPRPAPSPRRGGGGGGGGEGGRCFPARRRGRRPAAGERQAGGGPARPFPWPPRPEDGSAARTSGWRRCPSSFFFRQRRRRRQRRRIIVVWEEGGGDGLELSGLLLRRQHSAPRRPASAAPGREGPDRPPARSPALYF